MEKPGPKILISGLPGVGKTTLIKKVSGALTPLRPIGFYTDEIRSSGIRCGFALVGLDGSRGILAQVAIKSPARVGKYGVDITSLETFIDRLDFRRPDFGLFIIDEIGKMECLAPKFPALVRQLLSDKRPLIATIAEKGTGLISEIRRRSDVTLIQITAKNRDTVADDIIRQFLPAI